MDKTKPPSFSVRIPLLSRLVLWLGVAAMLAMMLWPMSETGTRKRFYLAGNRTHLHAVLAATSADPKSEADPLILYSSTDLKGKVWSEPLETQGNVAQVLAWQDDLVVLFADGGLSLFGPSNQGYRKSPLADDPKAWRWWLTAAADGDRLLALGLDAENRPVYCERGPDGWGDVTKVNLNVEWTAETGATMAAAVRDGELHIVWPSEPVADTPTGTGSTRRWLNYAWRDRGGKWIGPKQQKVAVRDKTKWIQPTGPIYIAPFGDKLAMVYAEVEQGAAVADEAAKPLRLAYAQFTPKDGVWHRVGRLELPAEIAKATTTYGFTAFGDGHALALNNDGDVTLLAMNAETGKLSAMVPPPELDATVTDGESTEGLLPLFLFSLAFMVLMMVVASRSMRRRSLHEQVNAGRLPREEAARIVAAQIERLMYLPVLVRRIGAALVDLAVASVASAVIIMQNASLWQLASEGSFASATGEQQLTLILILYGVLIGYYIIMELLWQRTLGKMLTKIHVANLEGGRPAWWRIVLRNLVRPADLALFGLVGLTSIIWSRRNQTLGDMAAGTRVVMNRTPSDRPDDTRVA